MDPLLTFPDPIPVDLADGLSAAGYELLPVPTSGLGSIDSLDAWSAAVVMVSAAVNDPGMQLCRELRARELLSAPVLAVVELQDVDGLALREDIFDDFVVMPLRVEELITRLKHLFWRLGGGSRPELVEYGPLALNLETFQAAIAGRPLDLTFMEYELLKFLAQHPGKVFTRETLLSRVWGYDYYGGARTVDVHIRRLRAKLSEEHAGLIQTVRSVGYRFGQSRWGL
jgi:DNA-binding response OmpR family regulator